MAHTILIVDSRREVMRTLQKALEGLRHAFIITSVMSGEEALLEARLNPVDLLITESRLPGMPGTDLVRAIRSVRPNVKTIILNGSPAENAHLAGVDAVFNKPVPIEKFLAGVTEILHLDTLRNPAPSAAEADQTLLPASPEDRSDTRISERLARLRHELNADSVTLVDDTGQIMIRAGGLQDADFETAILPSLIFSFNAGSKVSHLLGRSQQRNMYFYHGDKYDLVVTSLSGTYALVVATRALRAGSDSSSLHLKIDAAQKEIAGVLHQLGIPLTQEDHFSVPPFLAEFEEVSEVEVEELDDRLDSLLTQSLTMKLKNADDFWEPEENPPGSGTISADSLSYEQALRLGLVLGEDEDGV